jgi:hypothetical protein
MSEHQARRPGAYYSNLGAQTILTLRNTGTISPREFAPETLVEIGESDERVAAPVRQFAPARPSALIMALEIVNSTAGTRTAVTSMTRIAVLTIAMLAVGGTRYAVAADAGTVAIANRCPELFRRKLTDRSDCS